MRKVAFFVTSLNAGGIENYLLRFLQFSQDRITPYVVCKGNRFGDLHSEYMKISRIKLEKFEVNYFNVRSLLGIYRFLKRNEIEVICDFTGDFAGLPLLLARFANIKTRIAFYRGATDHFRKTVLRIRYKEFMHWLVNRYSTRILSNSHAALDFFFKKYGTDNRFNVIYNGINYEGFNIPVNTGKLREELNFPVDAFIVGHTGRYHPAKNQDTIIKVAIRLCKQYENIYFLLCGKGTEEIKDRIVSEYPFLSTKLVALGYRRDIARVLMILDVYFFPSLTEGQPNALIEAMVCDLPVIASNIPSIQETMPVKLHHILKDPWDTIGFAAEIEKSYLDRNYRDSLRCGEWARNRFDSAVLFNQFLEELL